MLINSIPCAVQAKLEQITRLYGYSFSLTERYKLVWEIEEPPGKIKRAGQHPPLCHVERVVQMTSYDLFSVDMSDVSMTSSYAAAGPVTLKLSGSGIPVLELEFGQLEIHDWWSHQGPKDLHWDRDCMRRWQCRHNGVFSSQPCPLQQVQRLKWFIFFSRDPWAPSPWTPPRNAISSYSCEL